VNPGDPGKSRLTKESSADHGAAESTDRPMPNHARETDNRYMSQVTVTPHHGRRCPGCMGNGACWVCLGNGAVTNRTTKQRVSCHRCHGTGLCAEDSRAAVVPDTATA